MCGMRSVRSGFCVGVGLVRIRIRRISGCMKLSLVMVCLFFVLLIFLC